MQAEINYYISRCYHVDYKLNRLNWQKKRGEVNKLDEENTLTLAEKLQNIIDNDIHEFLAELFEDPDLEVRDKASVTIDIQYSVERLGLAVEKLERYTAS